MRRLFWQVMVSLDGYFEGPNRELDWHVTDGDFEAYVLEMLGSIDALLFGRVTYQLMAAYWPTSTDPEARAMNELQKLVFSRTLGSVAWQNARLVGEDAAGEVAWLKRQPGKELALIGSADLATTLLKRGLIDELRILVAPVVLGAGRPMFKGVKDRLRVRLARTRTLTSGVVILAYELGGAK
jgi:dihydrofolate reductase